jgi:spore germination protein
MNHKTKFKVLLPLLLIFTTLCFSGCWDQMPFGTISFNLDIGVEFSDEKKLLVTRTSPVFEERVQEKTETYIVDADSIRQSRDDIRRMSPNLIVGGKLQHILISEGVAETGICKVLEIFERDPSTPNLCLVIVVKGSPRELLKAAEAFEDKPSPGYNMNRLFENNVKLSHIPSTRIYRFNIDYFSPGIDPVVPMIKLADPYNKAIKIIGSALFAKDKMVGELNVPKTSLLLAMMKKSKKNYHHITFTDLEGQNELIKPVITLTYKDPKRYLEIDLKGRSPVVNLKLNIQGTVDEYKWDGLGKEVSEKELEEKLSENMKKQCKEILKYIQEVGSDPIGIGDMVRAKHNSYWESVEWEEAYKKIIFNVDVKVDIYQYGIIK